MADALILHHEPASLVCQVEQSVTARVEDVGCIGRFMEMRLPLASW